MEVLVGKDQLIIILIVNPFTQTEDKNVREVLYVYRSIPRVELVHIYKQFLDTGCKKWYQKIISPCYMCPWMCVLRNGPRHLLRMW